MAKGNLFLGMGRGSVGDVTFYRADGQQLSRARNRKPRNPKTNAQLIQRAISATIVQAYKAGSIIFDHSFEGKSVPSGSQRAFLSANMRKLRAEVLAELNNNDAADTNASVVSPRAVFPVPNAYKVSEGSLIQNLFEVTLTGENSVAVKMKAANEGEKLSEYANRIGFAGGDIFTVVSFGIADGERTHDLVSGQCLFGFMRMIVKSAVAASNVLMANAKYDDIFEIDSNGAVIDSNRLVTTEITISDLDMAGSVLGSIGVIRSDENSGLRSTSYMKTTYDAGGVNDWGVMPYNLIAAWSQDSGSVDSELILEGGAI